MKRQEESGREPLCVSATWGCLDRACFLLLEPVLFFCSRLSPSFCLHVRLSERIPLPFSPSASATSGMPSNFSDLTSRQGSFPPCLHVSLSCTAAFALSFFYFLTQITLFFYRVSQAEFSWRGHRIGIREMEELTLEKARSKSSFHVWLHLKRPTASGPSLELLLRPVILKYQ